MAEVGISIRKYRWYNDLATRWGSRVSHGVSEGCKPYYPLGLREKHTETERSGRSEAPIPPPQRPSERRSQVPRRRRSAATRGFRPIPRPRQAERRLSEAVRADFLALGDQDPEIQRVGPLGGEFRRSQRSGIDGGAADPPGSSSHTSTSACMSDTTGEVPGRGHTSLSPRSPSASRWVADSAPGSARGRPLAGLGPPMVRRWNPWDIASLPVVDTA